MSQPVVILSALTQELGHLLDAMKYRKTAHWGGTEINQGLFNEREIVAFSTGVGKVRASSATQYAIDLFSPSSVLVIGAAGALAPDLHPGDVVVGEKVVEYDFDSSTLAREPLQRMRSWYPDAGLLKALVESARLAAGTRQVRVGTILTGDKAVVDAAERDHLRKLFQGDCVEMESAAVAAVCEQNSIACAAVRIVSDYADNSARDHFIGQLPSISFELEKIMKELLDALHDGRDKREKVPAAQR